MSLASHEQLSGYLSTTTLQFNKPSLADAYEQPNKQT
jgi:hypothetical protein